MKRSHPICQEIILVHDEFAQVLRQRPPQEREILQILGLGQDVRDEVAACLGIVFRNTGGNTVKTDKRSVRPLQPAFMRHGV